MKIFMTKIFWTERKILRFEKTQVSTKIFLTKFISQKNHVFVNAGPATTFSVKSFLDVKRILDQIFS